VADVLETERVVRMDLERSDARDVCGQTEGDNMGSNFYGDQMGRADLHIRDYAEAPTSSAST
jgi:hypothetical protein